MRVDSSLVQQPIELQIAAQEIDIILQKEDLLKSMKKPGFSLAYGAQNFSEGGYYSGIEAGISIPLFNQQIRKKMAAQRIALDKSKTALDSKSLEIGLKKDQVLSEIQRFAEGVAFYASQVDIVNPEIKRISKLNYEAGEISYLELLNTLELLVRNQKSYLEHILAHNKAVAKYQFISSQ